MPAIANWMIIMCIALFTVYPFRLIGHLIEHSVKEIRIWLKFVEVTFNYHLMCRRDYSLDLEIWRKYKWT